MVKDAMADKKEDGNSDIGWEETIINASNQVVWEVGWEKEGKKYKTGLSDYD